MAHMRKALAGAGLAFIAAMLNGWVAGGVGWGEVATAVGAAFVAGAGVYAIPNARRPLPPIEPVTVREPL